MLKTYKVKMAFSLALLLAVCTVYSAGIEKMDALNDSGEKNKKIDLQKDFDYGNLALALIQRLNYKKGAAKVLNIIGIIYNFFGKYDQALEYCQKSLKIREEIGDKGGIADSLNIIGNSCANLGKYEQALSYYQKSLKTHEANGYKIGVGIVLSNIGEVYASLGEYGKALEYFRKSLEIQGKTGYKIGIEITLNNIGVVYYNLGKYDQALENHRKSLKISEEIGNKLGISSALNNIGLVYINLGKYDRALVYCQKSLKLNEEIRDKEGIAISSNNIGDIYIRLRKFAEAEKYLCQGLKIGEEIKNLASISESYRNLSELFEAQNDFKKTFKYYKLYFEVYQKLFNEKSYKQINELQAKYEAEKRESELLKAKKNEEVQKIKLQKQILLRNSFFVGFILIAIIFVLLFKKYLYFFAFWKKEKYIGRYRLLDIIGSGGMSVVYKAHSIKEKTEKVAVKILKQEFSQDDSMVKRFKQEAVIIDNLDHPNIVRVFERGEDKNRLFIAMEYLEGKTLAEKIARESPIALPVCVHVLSQLADALAQIHGQKIVHRDLKPSNIILLERPGDSDFVKLLDFGLARTRSQATLTKTGELLGTIGYMSPEQLLDGDITTASDIYSLGVIFYEMVCGRRAFAAENEIQIIKRILDDMPSAPVVSRHEIPREMNRLILQMLDKDSGRRPSLVDFREQLHLLEIFDKE